MTTPEQEQPTTEDTEPIATGDEAGEDELGDPNARDTGDFAEVPDDEQAEVDDPDHPENRNEPVDLDDVTDDGQVVDVGDPEA